MNGYPPGTKCVITWVPRYQNHRSALRLGDVVETEDGFWTVGDYNVDISYLLNAGLSRDSVLQAIDNLRCWPVDWMRPLEDPDTHTVPTETEITA